MRILAYAAILALMAAPAAAQGMGGGKHHRGAATKTTDTKAKANDGDYKNALKNLPNKRYDPWGEVRPASATSPAAAR
jgi:hypothetical protein